MSNVNSGKIFIINFKNKNIREPWYIINLILQITQFRAGTLFN